MKYSKINDFKNANYIEIKYITTDKYWIYLWKKHKKLCIIYIKMC